MNYKKVFKRETKIIAYVVICLTLLVIGSSYALFLQVGNNSTNQVVEAGTLKITYSNGNTVSINNSNDETNCLYPQSDSTGSGSGGCVFTLSIQNTGTLPAEYNLLIYDDKDGNGNLVDQSLVRHSLKKKISSSDNESMDTVNSASPVSSLGVYQSSDKRVLETSTIQPNEIIVFTLNIWIDENATTDIIGKTVALKLDVVGTVYENDNDIAKTICKRASTLNTAVCSNEHGVSCAVYHNTGDTITYGSLGTNGILSIGDAFDCDVNGDGSYDERFYYVTDLEGYNDTAVLIYNKNSSSKDVPYHFSEIGNIEFNGPLEASKQLPTTSEWSNIKLKNSIRNITYSEDNSLESFNFDYTGYAARFLSYSEIKDKCQIPVNCEFLVENTGYSDNTGMGLYMIETLTRNYGNDSAINPFAIYYIEYVPGIVANITPIADLLSVRPVIEVSKDNIDY